MYQSQLPRSDKYYSLGALNISQTNKNIIGKIMQKHEINNERFDIQDLLDSLSHEHDESPDDKFDLLARNVLYTIKDDRTKHKTHDIYRLERSSFFYGSLVLHGCGNDASMCDVVVSDSVTLIDNGSIGNLYSGKLFFMRGDIHAKSIYTGDLITSGAVFVDNGIVATDIIAKRIESGKILVSGNINTLENLSVREFLACKGNIHVDGSFNLSGSAECHGSLFVLKNIVAQHSAIKAVSIECEQSMTAEKISTTHFVTANSFNVKQISSPIIIANEATFDTMQSENYTINSFLLNDLAIINGELAQKELNPLSEMTN